MKKNVKDKDDELQLLLADLKNMQTKNIALAQVVNIYTNFLKAPKKTDLFEIHKIANRFQAHIMFC